MNKTIFVSVHIDKKLYATCVTENSFVKNMQGCTVVGFDNTTDNQYIAKRYNHFLNEYDYNSPAWFVFCHSDWELREDLGSVLCKLDHNSLYGPIGAILYRKTDGTFVREYRGQCFEKKRDGTNERQLICPVNHTGAIVDTFDCQCLIVHSDLVAEHLLRFDENLGFDLYVEDFCIAAKKKYDIESKIIKVHCCHWNQADNMEGRESYYVGLDYLNVKYTDSVFAGVVSLVGGKSFSRECMNIKPNTLYTNFNERLNAMWQSFWGRGWIRMVKIAQTCLTPDFYQRLRQCAKQFTDKRARR